MTCHLEAPRPSRQRRWAHRARPSSRSSRFIVLGDRCRRRRQLAGAGGHHRHPRAGGDRPQHGRHRRHRRRRDPQHERGLGRGPDPPRRRHPGRPQRRAGPELGLLHPRREHEQHGRPRRRRSRRLGDARPGRVRGVQPGADRAHRGPARTGVEPVRCRRRRRRRPDLHAPRRRRAARGTRPAEVGGYHSWRGDAGASGAVGPWDYALSLGHEESRGVSAIAPGDQFGQFNPDRDGFKRDSGTLRLGFTPAPGHRIGVHLLETRLNAQYDAHRAAASSTIPRPTSAIAWSRASPRSTTAASRPARGRRRSRPRARSTT